MKCPLCGQNPFLGQGSREWEKCVVISIPKTTKLQFTALPCTELLPSNTTGWKRHVSTQQSNSMWDRWQGVVSLPLRAGRATTFTCIVQQVVATFSREHPRTLVCGRWRVEKVFRQKWLLKTHIYMCGISDTENWNARKWGERTLFLKSSCWCLGAGISLTEDNAVSQSKGTRD